MSPMPPFSPTAPRYDMDTFTGRCWYFLGATNPLRMLHTRTTIRNARTLLDEYDSKAKAGTLGVVNDAALWEARAVKEACVHPKTGEVLFPLFRFAAFAPVNCCIVPLMLLPSTVASPWRTIGVHWLNQSYNCAVNYSNRSSDALTTATILEGYALAVTASIATALAGTAVMRRMKDAASFKATLVRATAPFSAVVLSATVNLGAMRKSEWRDSGVDVMGPDGTVYGKSLIAGKMAVVMGCLSRVMLNIPAMMLPPLIMSMIARTPYFLHNARRRAIADPIASQLGVCVSVAPSLAAFNPWQTMPVQKLEPKFHYLLDDKPIPVTHLRYYRGL